MADEFISLARVVKTQGRRGEVAVEVYSTVPERFAEGMTLRALLADGNRRELKLEELWPHKGLLVLKFAGVDSISEAETLIRSELQVPFAERAKLDPGWTFISDLIGCTVFDGERAVGKVRDIQFGAGEAPLLLVKGQKEYDIPFAEAFLRGLDLERKEIRMELPDGMLEVNAPLTDDEKRSTQ